mmetsp:Transcript_62108/g.148128  ORF Transcript_62108/g.148128 Transcript_62108/m.148128 type:complete len:327 (+) Transcript_62108:154-1134(+)
MPRVGILIAALLCSHALALRPRNAYELEAQELHHEEQQHAHKSSLAAESLAEASDTVTREEALQQFRELVAGTEASSSDSGTPDAVLKDLVMVFSAMKTAWDARYTEISSLGRLTSFFSSTQALLTAINRVQVGLAQMITSFATLRQDIAKGLKTGPPMTNAAISQRFLFALGLMSTWYVQNTALLRGITTTQYNAQPRAAIAPQYPGDPNAQDGFIPSSDTPIVNTADELWTLWEILHEDKVSTFLKKKYRDFATLTKTVIAEHYMRDTLEPMLPVYVSAKLENGITQLVDSSQRDTTRGAVGTLMEWLTLVGTFHLPYWVDPTR